MPKHWKFYYRFILKQIMFWKLLFELQSIVIQRIVRFIFRTNILIVTFSDSKDLLMTYNWHISFPLKHCVISKHYSFSITFHYVPKWCMPKHWYNYMHHKSAEDDKWGILLIFHVNSRRVAVMILNSDDKFLAADKHHHDNLIHLLFFLYFWGRSLW